uniref:BTB domain-containing protein n=1 Tax=Oryza meridionalis TaxID=40149 RepID=A0A0E0EY53_9ORYZ
MAPPAAPPTDYHLLVINNYTRTKQAIPNGFRIKSGNTYCPNGDRSTISGYVSFHLVLDCDGGDGGDAAAVEPVNAKFEFSFADQVAKHQATRLRATKVCEFSRDCSACHVRRFVRREALERSRYLVDDYFTVRCDIVVVHAGAGAGAAATAAAPSMAGAVESFGRLLETRLGADVAFEVGGETFAAHRCVLAARSKVFDAELFGTMKEGTAASVVRIDDMDADVFRGLLSFVYTDELPEREDHGEEMETSSDDDDDGAQSDQKHKQLTWLQQLIVAADRYDLQRLKLLCEEEMYDHIGERTVEAMLILADHHHCRVLKDACLGFLGSHGNLQKGDGG